MKVDIQSLETFNQLAHEGAQQATASMSQMTGIDAAVDVTKISLVSRDDIGEELNNKSFVGVEFDYEGELAGETVLVFGRDCSDSMVESLMGSADGEMAKSGVKEIGNIMMSGFIDGWADYLETSIDHSPPTYTEGVGANILPA
ncbi:MAG: chemotaxis protein CheC, partial [Halapricum sp.]